jgi:hypothetical protein
MPLRDRIHLPIKHIRQDKRMSCWYACAQMVLAYRNPLMMIVNTSTSIAALDRYLRNKGLLPAHVATFAREIGLSWRLPSDLIKTGSPDTWTTALQLYGPLWVPITKIAGRSTYGHLVVLSGVRADNSLWVNDPEEIAATAMPAAHLGATLFWKLPVLFKLTAGAI